jgi:UDP-glucose 4-epimerase
MAQPKTVLVTGASGYWGWHVAARLATLPDVHVIGVDSVPPKEAIQGLDFIQADVRNPLLASLLREEAVDAVCHLAFLESDHRSEAAFDLNVMGTMRVFGACTDAGVGKIIFKSSTVVYGAHPMNPAFISEERALAGNSRSGTVRDLLEIESFCNGFRGQWPDIALTILRFPSIIGPKVSTPMTRFLRASWTPTLLGFDPQMQVVHEDDVVEAVCHVVCREAPGVFNIAAEGVLPLSKLMALAGKLIAPPVFHLAAYWGNPVARGMGLPVNRAWPIELDYLRYPWVADLGRMRDELEFVPRYTSVEALRELAGRHRLEKYLSDGAGLSYDEERLRDTIERRRRARQHPTYSVSPDMETAAGEGEEDSI